jgi:hypothetical protein
LELFDILQRRPVRTEPITDGVNHVFGYVHEQILQVPALLYQRLQIQQIVTILKP